MPCSCRRVPGRTAGHPKNKNIMTRLMRFAALIICCLVCLWQAPYANAAQENDKPGWWFNDEAQMRMVVPKHVDDLRATYRIILRARDLHLSGQAAFAYMDIAKQRMREANSQAAFAFAHFTAIGPGSDDFMGKGTPQTLKLRDLLAQAALYRDDSLRLGPRSPAINLMASLPTFYYASAGSQDRSKAYTYVRRAIRLAPTWGDAYYWLGKFLSSDSYRQDNRVGRANECIQVLHKAEKLDPRLHAGCLMGYAYAYQALRQYDKALENFDAAVKAKPKSATPPMLAWREYLARQLKTSSSSASLR